MSPNTGGNTGNENAESNESVKSVQSSRLDVFAKQFADDMFLKTPKEERFSMMNTYFSNDTYTSDQEREIMKFAGTKEGFSDLKLDDINYYNIRKYFNKAFVQHNSTFVMFKNKVLKHYDITHNEYLELVIESELKSMSLDSINELLKSTKKLDDFIDDFKQNSDKEINKKDSESILPKNFAKIITDKIENLPENKRQEVDDILVYFKNSHIREESFARNFSEKIHALHVLNIFSKTEITELVVTFVPSISIKDAKKHITSGQENNFKNDVLKTLNLENASLSENEKKAIYDSLDDLLIDTSIFLDSDFSDLKSVLGDKKLLEKAGDEIKQTIIGVENENGISTFAGFKDALKDAKINIEGIDNFKRGSIIEYIIKDKEGNTKKQYYQIESNIDKVQDGGLLFINRGINALGGEDGNKNTSFKELLDGMKKFKENNLLVGFKVYDSDLLKEKIKEKEIVEDNDIGEFNTETQIESNINRRTQEINSQLSDEEKTQEIEKIELEEKGFNMQLLKKKVNHIDKNGVEFGLEVGTTISFVDDNRNTNIFTITGSDQNTISIDYGNGNTERILFEEFFSGFTRDPIPERISKINTESDFLDQLKKDDSDTWSKMEIKDGKFVKKEKDAKLDDKHTEYNLFIGEKNIDGVEGNLMKLHKIENGKAIVSYGKADYEILDNAEKKKFDEKLKEGKTKKNYSIDSKKYEIPLGVFHNNIKESGAVARNFEKEIEKPDLPEAVEMNSGFMSKLFKRASLADIISSGKLILDSIENKLKEGNEEMAANWADKVWLPKDMKADMKTRIEQAQKKRGDEFFDRLKTVDSKDAIEMVKRIITDKNSPEAKREACLLFMAKSYGNLYTKGPLFEHQGKFLWYTSFGGTIGDKMYREIEQGCLEDGVNFTEHDLMIKLLSQQCRDKPPKPKRRSKLHKEYKAMMGDGKKDEQAKGEKDASEKRTFNGRLHGVVLDELKDGGHNNAIGAIEELIGKGDDGKLNRLETLPFAMMMSGVGYDLDSDHLQNIRSSLGKGVPLITLGHMSSRSGMELYNNTVVEIAKVLETENPLRYKGIINEAKTLVINSKNSSIKPRDRIDSALEFYDKYSDILSRTLNMTASRRVDEDAKYESLIYLEAHKPGGNKILKDYYEQYSGTANNFLDLKAADPFVEDAYQSKTGAGYGGITGMCPEEVFSTFFQGRPGQIYALKSSEMIQNEFIAQLKAYTATNFKGGNQDRDIMMSKYIRAYIYGFLINHESNKDKGIAMYPGLKFLGLKKGGLDNVSYSDFKSTNEDPSNESTKLIETCLNNVLGKSTHNNEGFDINNVDGFVDDVKNQTNKVIDKEVESSNDQNNQEEIK